MKDMSANTGCWSEYWRQGALTTFSEGAFQHGYEGPIAEFWASVLDTLPVDARILDLGTGNGAMPALIAKRASSTGKEWQVVGVDSANIDQNVLDKSLAAQGFQKIVTLIGETPMESTGLPSRSFDLLTSQFGIEYGDLALVVREARRLLQPPGSLAFVMHHHESKVVQAARRDYEQTQMVIEEERFDRKVAELAKATASATTFAKRKKLKYYPEAEKWRHQVNRSIARLSERLSGKDASQMLRVTQTFLRIFSDLKNHPRDEKLEFIRRYREAMRAYAARMKAMAGATLTSEEAERFYDLLKQSGFSDLRTDVVRHPDGEVLGRTIIANLKT